MAHHAGAFPVLSYGDEDAAGLGHAAATPLKERNEQRRRSMNLGLTPPSYELPPLRGWEGK